MSANRPLSRQWEGLLLSCEEIPHIWWHINNTAIKIQSYLRLMKESLVGREGCEIRKFKPVPLIKSHKIPNMCSTLTSHPAMTECCNKSVEGLGTALAHKPKKVFQHCLFLPTPSSKNHSQAQTLQEAPPAITTLLADKEGLIPPSAPTIRPGRNVGGEESLPVLKRNSRYPASPERKLSPYLGNITLCHRTGETFPTRDS